MTSNVAFNLVNVSKNLFAENLLFSKPKKIKKVFAICNKNEKFRLINGKRLKDYSHMIIFCRLSIVFKASNSISIFSTISARPIPATVDELSVCDAVDVFDELLPSLVTDVEWHFWHRSHFLFLGHFRDKLLTEERIAAFGSVWGEIADKRLLSS